MLCFSILTNLAKFVSFEDCKSSIKDNTLLDFWNFKQKAAKAAARAMIRKGLPEREGRVCRNIFEVYDEYGVEYQKIFYQVIHPYKLEVGQAERIQELCGSTGNLPPSGI